VVLGLDGAGFNYLDPILESGRLEGFSRLFASGVRSDCLSTIPPITPPAWSTMLTGVNPGKHGVLDFLQPDSSGVFRMVDATFRRRKTFLAHAVDNGIRTISLLVPYTFPPDPDAGGLVVSGLGTPSAESDFIRPHKFRGRLLRDFPFLQETEATRGRSLDNLHERLLEHTRNAVDLVRWAMKEIDDWGLCFGVFQATDLIPHFYSRFFDPDHPEYDADDNEVAAGYRDALAAIYRAIDPLVGECLDALEAEGGWVILVSDHGSRPLMGAIGKDAFLARWLEEEGYLVTRGAAGRARQAAKAKAGSVANRLLYLVKRYTPHGLRDAANRLLGRRKEAIVSGLSAVPFLEDVDWKKTRAFCAPGGYGVGLYINREGDFPEGVVPKGAAYHKLREEMKDSLRALEIAPGVPLFTRVLLREEALWGPAVALAPDLILMWREDRRLAENDYRLTDGRRLDRPEKKPGSDLTWCGTHSMEGLFAIAGDGVRSGAILETPPNLADVLPTVHLVADLPIPSDVDGRVIENAGLPERPSAENGPAGGWASDEGSSGRFGGGIREAA
jgi:predicted AlkP superfamily phosphohydrolase/phosphomutase